MRLSLTNSTPLFRTRTIVLIVVAVLVIAGAAIIIIFYNPDPVWYLSIGWLVAVAILVWGGNKLLTRMFDRLLPWDRAGTLRFFVQLLVGLTYLLLLVNVTYIILRIFLTPAPPSIEQIIVMNVWGAFIFIPGYSIYFSLHFLRHWRKSELEVERYQKEHIRSQLSQLKNHLDPHFLFNNLNILSALVDRDPGRSKDFIANFANVYRSLLKATSGDLTSLTDEIEFIESYIFLLRTRFENNIVFTINVEPAAHTRFLPPASIQMLVENAIKHNNISEDNPLVIQILQMEEDYLIVSNTLNEKTSSDDRDGSGLENIRKRYSHFTDKEVCVIRSDTHFEVHIPLLNVEHL